MSWRRIRNGGGLRALAPEEGFVWIVTFVVQLFSFFYYLNGHYTHVGSRGLVSQDYEWSVMAWLSLLAMAMVTVWGGRLIWKNSQTDTRIFRMVTILALPLVTLSYLVGWLAPTA